MASNPKRPSSGRRGLERGSGPISGIEDVLPTTVHDPHRDQELAASYNPHEVGDDGFRPAFLYVEKGPGAGQLVPVRQGSLVIGRASVADLRLQHPSISRRHAQLIRRGELFFIKDLGSQNGTFVNQRRLSGEVEVQPGDLVALGNAVIRLRGPIGRSAPTLAKPVPASSTKPRRPETKVQNAARPMSSSARWETVKIASIAMAVGFGFAGALLFAAMKLGGLSVKEKADSVAPAKTEVAAEVPKAKSTGKAKQRFVVEMDEEPTITASPKPAPKAEEPVKAAPAPKAAEPVLTGPKKADILAKYESGNLEAAIDLAKDSSEKDFYARLLKFQESYSSGKKALAANDASAITHFESAFKVDQQLSKGFGAYATELRRELSHLWTLVGFKHLENENSKAARQAFSVALSRDPSNDKAKGELAKLDAEKADAAPTPAPKASASKSIDSAFEDDPAPLKKPAAKPASKPTRSAIDDAFDE